MCILYMYCVIYIYIYFFFNFKAWSCKLGQIGLEFAVLLPHSSKVLDYSLVPLHPAVINILNYFLEP